MSSIGPWTRGSASGRASRASCTIRCSQSLQGLLLRFQMASNLLPARPAEAKERLDAALDQAEAAITEGRDAVHGLRTSAVTVNDLASGIAAIGAELTSDPSAVDAPAIDLEIEGPSRDLNPVVREEAYRIAGEALRNAFKHAQARRIRGHHPLRPGAFRLPFATMAREWTLRRSGDGRLQAISACPGCASAQPS